jgi:hypothetical protein
MGIVPDQNFAAETFHSRDGNLIKGVVEVLIPYTVRYLQRIDKLLEESFVVDYILSEMDEIRTDMVESYAWQFDLTDMVENSRTMLRLARYHQGVLYFIWPCGVCMLR